MKDFTYSEPYIYPHPESGNAKTGYKDRNNKPITKWFIKYIIIFADGVKVHRKEYGNSYNIDLNRIKNLKTKMYEATILRDYVEDDLKNGIDPLNRKKALEERALHILNEAEKYSVRYVFEQWFSSKNYLNPIPSKEISAKTYLMFYNNSFIPYLEERGLAEDIRLVNDMEINKFIKEKFDSGDWSAFTCNVRIGWLGGVFKYAFRQKLIQVNPMNFVDRITENKILFDKNNNPVLKKKKEARFSIFTSEEIDHIFNGFYDTPFESIAKTVYYSFLRFSEIFRLRLSDLDLNEGCYYVRPEIAKGQRDGRTHKVRIYPKLLESLNRYVNSYFGVDRNPHYYLFYHIEKTNPSSYSIFQHALIQLKKALKAKGVVITKSAYSLKHSGAKRFIDVNKKKDVKSYQIIEAIMKQMRHSDFSITQKYIYKDLGINLDDEDVFSFD